MVDNGSDGKSQDSVLYHVSAPSGASGPVSVADKLPTGDSYHLLSCSDQEVFACRFSSRQPSLVERLLPHPVTLPVPKWPQSGLVEVGATVSTTSINLQKCFISFGCLQGPDIWCLRIRSNDGLAIGGSH